ncbi:MAG: hypothetical protein H0A76_00895 [Candidatus Thiodubiliella endoseptemdiera]|uniref:Uncharacterized protein n=1 Tax=Candidatus Thiodubiliella endoseptemdiera TaxID=2738886 RepID=A0A853F441_9GAMM|nr:hypothetical protein [Candidatus Thiodubiliella endoseptemdiera]
MGAIAAISVQLLRVKLYGQVQLLDADGTTGGSSVAATYQWTVSDTGEWYLYCY